MTTKTIDDDDNDDDNGGCEATAVVDDDEEEAKEEEGEVEERIMMRKTIERMKEEVELNWGGEEVHGEWWAAGRGEEKV